MKKNKLKKLLLALKPENKPVPKLVIRREIQRVIEKAPKQKSYLPIFASFISKIKSLGVKQKESNVRLEKKIEEAVKSIPEVDIETPIKELKENIDTTHTQLMEAIEKLTEDFEKKIQENKTRVLRFEQQGGGSMNRQILIGGTDYLTRYTDINLIGAITATNDDAKKRVNIDFTGLVGGATLNDVSNDSTTTPKSLYQMTAGIPVEFRSSDSNPILYIDESNERVGIGTNAPSNTFHVAPNTNSTLIGPAPAASFRTGSITLTANGGFINSIRTGDNVFSPFFELQKSRGTITSPTSVAADDNLGVFTFWGHDGTAMRASSEIRAQVDGTPGSSDMPGRLTFWTTPDASATLAERARITSNGNFLIGTTAVINHSGVNAFLNVATNVSTDRLSGFDYFANDASGPIIVLAKSRHATIGSFTYPTAADSLGLIFFSGANESDARFNPGASIQGIASSTWSVTNQETHMMFLTTASGAITRSEAMRILSNGNVGIGTTTPNTEALSGKFLSISGGTTTFGNIELVTSADDGDEVTSGTVVFTNTSQGASDGNIARIVGVASGATAFDRGGYLGFWTKADAGNLTERWRITNTGHLVTALDNTYDIGISSDFRPRTGYFGTSVVTPSITISGLTAGRVIFAGSGGLLTDDSDFTFATDTLTVTKIIAPTSVSTPSIITASGALGITPTAGSNVNINLSTTGDFAVSTNQFYVDTSAGFVGIATSSPDEAFHVSGSTAGYGAHIGNLFVGVWDANSSYSVFVHNSLKATSGSYALIQQDDGSTYLNAASGKAIALRINNSDTMTIASSGNVGIGDTTPDFLLDVAGTLGVDGNVTLGGGTITLSVDTNFVLSGGVNGVSFDTDTLSIDGSNNRVGFGLTVPPVRATILSAQSVTTNDLMFVFDTSANYRNGIANQFNSGDVAENKMVFRVCDTGTTSQATVMTLIGNGNAYFENNVSALSYTDRTPFYSGDALEEIKKISGKNGEIDHSTLPAFAQKDVGGEPGRDLGAMISILTKAIQQLQAKIELLENQ